MASPLREAEIHLIVQNATDEWLMINSNGIPIDDDGWYGITLPQMIKLAVEIISLIPKEDKQRQSSLCHHGIINTLNRLTNDECLEVLDLNVWECLSKIILNISTNITQIIGLVNDDIMDLIRLSHQCFEFGLVLQEEEQEEYGANHILENSIKSFANIQLMHVRPIINDLPLKVFKQMIQILSLTENITICQTILIILDVIMQNNVTNINTLVNQCDLLDALQKIINTRRCVTMFKILSRLLDSCHAAKVFEDYPFILSITIKNAFTSFPPDHASINCLNSLLQNNKNSLLIRTNYVDSLYMFLKGLDNDSQTLVGLEPYHSLFHNTLNAFKNMESNSNKLLQDIIQTLEKYELK